MAKAIIWSRVSTTSQEMESQKNDLIRIATSKPFSFKESDLIFIGDAGASAIKMNDLYQKEVNQLIHTIDNTSDIKAVFVWEVSRLARNKAAFQQMTAKLIEKKIQLKCNVPDIKLLDDNGELNNGMELTFDLLITLAKQEMEIKKKRFARGKEQKAKEGKFVGGRIPFGYRAIKERDNIIDVNEKEAEIVKTIFDMYDEGYSQTKIALELQEKGILNPRYEVPRIIQLGLISNILRNPCYTGELLEEETRTEKVNGEERTYKRYERRFPQIITVEQFKRCEDIAKVNRTVIGKGKNIYYANHLVRCSTCGCFWSASSSKVNYHCYNATRPSKLWAVNGRTTQQCNNKTSLSINILDSVLWYFAKREEAAFILTASKETIDKYNAEIEDYQTKINAIPTQLDKIAAEIERLALRNAEGHISDKTFEEKVAEKNRIKSQLIDKKLSFQKKIKEIESAINKINETLKEYGVKNEHTSWEDKWKENADEQIRKYNEIYNHQCNITDDAVRYEIIHRMISGVKISDETINYKFKIGWKETKARRIDIFIKNWEMTLYKDGYRPRPRIYTVYYLPFNGRDCGLFIERDFHLLQSGFIFKDGVAGFIGYQYTWEWLKDYNNYSEVEYINRELPHRTLKDPERKHIKIRKPEKARIINIPYLNRFIDLGKKKRRENEKEKAYKPVEGYLRMEDVMALCKLQYNQVYSAIRKGELKAQHVRHKFFISPEEANNYAASVAQKREHIGNKISAFEVAKRYNLNYPKVLRLIKNGVVPFEQIDGGFFVNAKEAEDYFSKLS